VEKSSVSPLKTGDDFYSIRALLWEAPPEAGNNMKTYSAKPETVSRDWFVVDAEGKTLGRMATEIARRLRGKHKPEYTPHVDTGDYIVVINAEKVRVTGKKASDKIYYHHTGYIGGIKSISFEKLIQKAPERTIQNAVKGMLPRGPLGRAMFKKLKVYAGNEHPHTAQQPQELTI
jgi:large subunit ribosomal protein L13